MPLRDESIRLGVQVFGSAMIAGEGAFTVETTPVEWLAEGRFALDDDKRLLLTGFGGTRMAPGYAPDFRLGAAIGYSFDIVDTKPPSPPREVKIDVFNEAVDTDKDGYPDSLDLCPTEPEDKRPPYDTDGCPIKDKDGDGIVDARDKCVDVAEDKDGIDDKDGCPEDDADGDQIGDPEDACPKEPGVKSADKDKNGCPRFIRRIEGSNEIQILKKVEFEFGSAKLTPASFPILDEVASLLIANPDIRKMSIEGHTDDKGNDALNLKLSKDRARSCLEYLVGKGITEGRLASDGFGEGKPLESNATPEGRAKNRRVEFKITDQVGGAAPEPAAKPASGGDAPAAPNGAESPKTPAEPLPVPGE
jgi:outer membrane protein OmpA-like peptidoglycan-associated protein